MAPRKLSDSDKSEIVDLYREPGQTTSTLAEQYGVSNSTVSRILKTSIPSEEYSELIAQKRMSGSDKSAAKPAKKSATPARRKKTKSTAAKAQPKSDTPAVLELEPEKNQPTADKPVASGKPQKGSGPKLKSTDKEAVAEDQAESKTSANKAEEKTTTRRRRRRSRATDEDTQLPLLNEAADKDTAADSEAAAVVEDAPPKSESAERPKPILASQRVEEEEDDDDDDDDLLGLDETLGDDFGDDDEEEDDDEEDDGVDMPVRKASSEAAVEIMPLGDAVLPKPCYLVVDMRAELITRPLVEFSDLGKIPSSEEREKTLPVFDNHRVARRFSRNKQRVIKVPDGGLITRTSPYLKAKGITRLLVDGQVFDLVGVD